MADQALSIVKSEPLPPLSIVNSAPAAGSVPLDARGRPAVSSDTSDAPPSAMARWFEEKLRPLLETVAHPQTIADIAQLLVPDAGVTGSVRAGAKAIAATGRGVEAVAQSPITQRVAEVVGGAATAGESFRGSPVTGAAMGASIAAAPKVAAAGGRTLQKIGGALERAATDVPAAATEAAKSPQQLLNEEALTARRNAFTAQQQAAAATAPTAQAARDAFNARSAAAPISAPIAAAEKVSLTADEVTLGAKLVRQGNTPAEALDIVMGLRDLTKDLPSSAAARAAVKLKNYKS